MKTHLETGAQKVIRTFNVELLVTVFSLCVIGLFTLYSATRAGHLESAFQSQIVWLLISFAVGGVMIFIDTHLILRFSYMIYGICLGLLVLVLLFGQMGGGSQRWLSLGFIRLQPSELAKIGTVLALAKYFQSERSLPPYPFQKLLLPALIVLPAFLLILVQPDFGTAGLVVLICASVVLFIGIRLKTLLVIGLVCLISVPLTYQFVLKDYQKKRVITFLNPERDPQGAGYNAIQSKIAVGSGGILGKGYLKGTQSHLNFIPEQHTDFIFSTLAEERGFLGACVLILLYLLYCVFSLKTLESARNRFEMLASFGFMAMVFWHVVINLGMVLGLLPIVGVTLPFLSYGGSSLMTFMLITGFILNVSRKRYIF